MTGHAGYRADSSEIKCLGGWLVVSCANLPGTQTAHPGWTRRGLADACAGALTVDADVCVACRRERSESRIADGASQKPRQPDAATKRSAKGDQRAIVRAAAQTSLRRLGPQVHSLATQQDRGVSSGGSQTTARRQPDRRAVCVLRLKTPAIFFGFLPCLKSIPRSILLGPAPRPKRRPTPLRPGRRRRSLRKHSMSNRPATKRRPRCFSSTAGGVRPN